MHAPMHTHGKQLLRTTAFGPLAAPGSHLVLGRRGQSEGQAVLPELRAKQLPALRPPPPYPGSSVPSEGARNSIHTFMLSH